MKITPRKLSTLYQRALIVGDPGSGKTRFLSTAALDDRTYPCLYLECGANPQTAFDYERVPLFISIEKLEDYDIVYDYLLKGQNSNHPFAQLLADNKALPSVPFKSLVIDGLTTSQQLVIDEVDKKEKVQSLIPFTKRERKISDIVVTAQDASALRAYRALKSQQNFQAKSFYTLNIHVFMSALKDERLNPMTGVNSNSIMLDGQSRAIFPSYCSLVGLIINGGSLDKSKLERLKAKPSDILLSFSPSEKYYAKDGFNLFNGKWLINPTVSVVLDAAEAKLQHLIDKGIDLA